jgi:hypothetical protein
VLYSRRIENSYKLIESLGMHKQKVANWQRYLSNLEVQLQQN